MKIFIKKDIQRSVEGGWGFGYVVIPKEHPLYGKDCDEIHKRIPNLKVHGRLTFADGASHIEWEELPKGSENSWIIGFHTQKPGDTLEKWSKKAVFNETVKLKRQIVEYTHNLVEQYMNTIVDTTVLENYMQDGADPQARAVLAYLQESVWICVRNPDSESSYFMRNSIKVARWENGREQGYVVSLTNSKDKQLNIAFFDSQNLAEIWTTKWEQNMDTVTVYDADFGGERETDGDTRIDYLISYSVDYGEAYKMALWITQELERHWGRG